MGSPAAVPNVRRPGAPPAMMRAFAVLLGFHGVAHLAGTSDSFSMAADGEPVDYPAGTWTVSDPTMLRVVAVRAGGLSRAGAQR